MNIQEARKAYAASFVSFLIRNLENSTVLNTIILYGSVAKSQSAKESDVDIFIDVSKQTKAIKKRIQKIRDDFEGSKEAIVFGLLGIHNPIALTIGRLDDWEDLKRSILSDGIVLWGRVEAKERPPQTEHKIVFFWDRVGKTRTAFLNKLYGYKTKNLRYVGLLEKWSGAKLGKSCIIIPIRYRDEMIAVAKKYKANARSIEVFC